VYYWLCKYLVWLNVRETEGVSTGLLHYFMKIISSMQDAFNSSCHRRKYSLVLIVLCRLEERSVKWFIGLWKNGDNLFKGLDYLEFSVSNINRIVFKNRNVTVNIIEKIIRTAND